MKKIAFILFIVMILPVFTLAQEQLPAQKHEIGIVFSSFNNFGMVYKTGKKNTLFRARLLALDLGISSATSNKSDSTKTKHSGYGAGILLGFEKRVPIVKHLSFVAGLDAGVQYTYSRTEFEYFTYSLDTQYKRWTISPVLSGVIGFSYTIKEVLVLSVELYPSVVYSFTKEKGTYQGSDYEVKEKNLGFGFSNSTAGITVAYRFGK